MHPESVIAKIESVADPGLAEDWDQSGVQVAAARRSVHRLAVALDPTPATIARAVDWKADFILTHHPLSLAPELPCRLNDYHAVLKLLFGREAWLYSAHTSLDLQTSGPVAWLARSLRLEAISPIVPVNRNAGDNAPLAPAGYGVQGDCPAPLDWNSFLRELHRLTGLSCWRRTGRPAERISRIAYCPGSGMSLAGTAFDRGADVFLSGDLKYHAAQEMESCGPTLDVGHFVLEEEMMRAWAQELRIALAQDNVDVAFFPGHDPIVWETNP